MSRPLSHAVQHPSQGLPAGRRESADPAASPCSRRQSAGLLFGIPRRRRRRTPMGPIYVTQQPSYYAPGRIWSLEMGEKSRFDDRRFTLDADVFYVKWTNPAGDRAVLRLSLQHQCRRREGLRARARNGRELTRRSDLRSSSAPRPRLTSASRLRTRRRGSPSTPARPSRMSFRSTPAICRRDIRNDVGTRLTGSWPGSRTRTSARLRTLRISARRWPRTASGLPAGSRQGAPGGSRVRHQPDQQAWPR